MDSINSFIHLLDKIETQDRRLGMTIKNLRCLTGEKSMELAYAMALKLAEESEKLTLLTRALPAYTGNPRALQDVDAVAAESVPIEAGFTIEGWFCIRLPLLLPKKERGSASYIRGILYPALRNFFQGKAPVRYPESIMIFRHVYEKGRPERRYRDHDNTEGLTEEMLAVRASRMLESGRLASYDRQVYRAVTARTEQSLAWAVYRMLTYEKAGSHVNIDTEISAEEKKQGIQLASEQRHAVTTALTSQLSVITGGPGTGKTLIQRFLLDIYRRKNRGAKIICCAPTGRAARRMEQSTGFPATTIHKALGLLAGEDGDYCEPEMLDADLIVVDEVSMMDIYLANHLFRSVPHGSQLVLIGDADQLPSVGPGAVLSEIIACGAVPVVRLDRIFRQSYGSRIAANAKLIRHGNLSLEYGEDFQFYDSCDMSASAQQIETLYLQETARYGVDNVALLTPYRQKTETGVNALNERLREKLNPQDGKKPEVVYRKRIYRLGDKVMQIKNCEDISNGDIGYITSVTRDDTDSVLTVDFGDGRIAEYDGSDLEMLDLAYASTIHKSQGSEYKSVIINLQCAHAVMLVRPLVYTAITRAKERVLIVGERRALCIAIKRTDTEQRGTMLSARIKELISNVKGDHYNGNLAQ